jgi:hypothetical protein
MQSLIGFACEAFMISANYQKFLYTRPILDTQQLCLLVE